MTLAPHPASTAERWQVDRVDLDSYLRRIGHYGAVSADGDTLARLHRAHVAAIPFENLDVVLGRPIEVDLPAVQDKLVARRRGGYCYEQNVLFGAVLQRIGFTVDRVLARTGDPLTDDPRPRAHLVLLVVVGGSRWLADVGFGSGLLEPIPLAEDIVRRQGRWTNRLLRGTDGEWRLQESADGVAFTTQLTFGERPDYPVDVAVANYNTSTDPHSPFTRQIIAVRKDETSVRRLIGRELSVERPGVATDKRDLTDAEVGPVLTAEFQIPLTVAEARALREATGG